MGKDYCWRVKKALFPSLLRQSGPVLVTGHTGFKGAWLIQLLNHLEIPVVGYSLEPERNSLFERAGLEGTIPEIFEDIRETSTLESFMNKHRPSTVLHLAAQPLVLKSYENPEETFSVNVMGTIKVLESAFKSNYVKKIGIITTDKVYKNENLGRRFIESDPLGGKDPYSASKVGTESVVAAWQQIQKISGGPKVMSLRAGNVIGGGDFAADRIIPDLVRARISEKSVSIRNPLSTRPWQHALDPLMGYLTAMDQVDGSAQMPNALNFGPSEESLSVGRLVEIVNNAWNHQLIQAAAGDRNQALLEAVELGLDSSLANRTIQWSPRMNQIEAIERTAEWWNKVLSKKVSPIEACNLDIEEFISRF
jgi:CDP-glucose 4,6-dehydratase